MNRASLSIVLATDSRDPSGIGHHMITLGVGLASDHRVALVFPSVAGGPAFVKMAQALGLDAVEIDTEDEACFKAFLAERKPDVLHVHAGIGWEAQALAIWGHSMELAVVRTEHLPWLITDPEQKVAHARAATSVHAFIFVSDAAAKTWAPALARHGLNPRLVTIPNGVVPLRAHTRRDVIRASLDVEPQESLLLCIARFTAQKDHGSLIEAYALLRSEGLRVRLALVGDGGDRAGCEEMVAATGLGGVDFLGQRDDIGDLLEAADLLVLPSLFEGLPLVVLEAMAVSLPVVATRIGGNVEALGSEHPFLCEAGNPADLARALSEVIAHSSSAQDCAAAQLRRFDSYFTAQRMTIQTVRLYRSVVRTASTRKSKGQPVQKTRIGIVGCGGIAHRHLGVLETFEDVAVVAVADQDLERAQELATRAGARAFPSHQQLLAETELDALWICLPPFAHGAPERAAIAQGIPFFVEKPVSLDMELAIEIDEAVRRAGLITAVGYHWRYLDTVDEARRLLGENPAHLMLGYWLDQTPPPEWWQREDGSGGQIVEQATHIIDLARFLAGDVVEVYGMAAQRGRAQFPGLDVATASTATLRFACGAIANLSATCLLRWRHRIGLHVFADALAIELTDHDIMIDTGHGRPMRSAEGDPVWREDRAFVDAVRGGKNCIRTPYAEAVQTHLVALAIARSARSGTPVRMEAQRADRRQTFASPMLRVPVLLDAHRTIRSLGFEKPGRAFYTEYREGPAGEGEVRLDLCFTGFSAGTELTFLKATNPYLHARWDEVGGVFSPGEPSASFPVPFVGYMEVGRIVVAQATGFAPGDLVATTFGHKSGHTANPSRDLLLTLPPAVEPILGVFVAQMGPICANGILHADAETFGAAVPRLGAGIAGRPVIVWGGGTVGLITALFARRAGAEVLVAEPSAWRREIAKSLGFEALAEEEAWRHAKAYWHGPSGRGAEFVFQTRARSESLQLALRALRPQGTVIDLAFYQGGLNDTRLGEEFHHNGLTIRCAQINRIPRPLTAAWDRRRLAQETLALLMDEGDAIRRHLITHVVPFDEGADFLRHLLRDRPEFLQIVFEAA